MLINLIKFLVMIFTFNTLWAAERPINYKSACSTVYDLCKNDDWGEETNCLGIAIQREKMSDNCREEIKYALGVKKKIADACEKNYVTKCKDLRPFSPDAIKCVKTKNFSALCSQLVNIHLK